MNGFDNDKGMKTVPFFSKLSDSLVDFFGILIPGIVFTLVIFLISLNVFFLTISPFHNLLIPHDNYNFLIKSSKTFIDIIKTFHMEIFAIFIICSYILGHIFFRLGPEEPDQKSFLRIFDRNKENPVHIDTSKNYAGNNFSKKDKERISLDVKWPYKDLDKYFQARILYFEKMVPWRVQAEDNDDAGRTDKHKINKFNRTKMIINVIKDAIQFHFPDKYRTIARNEALVRLMSSTWFMSNIFKKVSFGMGLLVTSILIVLIIISRYFPLSFNKTVYLGYAVSIIFYFLLFVIFKFITIYIEKGLHYQRVREIIFILSIAFQARKKDSSFCREIWPENFTDNLSSAKEDSACSRA